MQFTTGTPYCGAPPSPATLWSRWNLDPVLIVALVAIAVAYFIGARRARLHRREQALFGAGWAITALALVSPLCALSVSLFAARVGQHMVLVLIGAPLVAAGRPGGAMRRLGLPCRRDAGAPLLAAAVFAALLWFWHTPVPYAATFASTTVYWSMHVTVYGTGLWLWCTLLDSAPARMMPVLGASVGSTVQMGLLGALITFAPRAMYAPHLLTTTAWGLTPLQDQQLGGAIMWVPGCAIFLGVAMLVLARTLTPAGAADRAAIGGR